MGDASNWLIQVRDAATDTLKGSYAWLSGELDVAGQGTINVELGRIKRLTMSFDNVASDVYYNCVQATFLGFIPGMSDLDIVQIFTKGFKPLENVNTYYPRFSGRAESPGAPDRLARLEDDIDYRIVGHAEELKTSVDDNDEIIAGTILGALANHYALNHAPASVLSTSIQDVTDIEGNPYNANYAVLYDILAGLAAKAKKSGKTVLFGVNGSRTLWWRERGAGSFSVDERNPTHKVVWPSKITQGYCNAVRYEIASANVHSFFYTDNPFIPTLDTPDLLTHSVNAGAGPFIRKKTIDVPSDLVPIKQIPGNVTTAPPAGTIGYELMDDGGILVSSWDGEAQDVTPSLSRLFDNNPRTYSVITQGSPPFFTNTPRIQIKLRFGAGLTVQDLVAIRVNLKLDETTSETNDGLGDVLHRIYFQNPGGEMTFEMHRGRDIPDTTGFYVVGDRGRAYNGNAAPPTLELWILGARGVGGPAPQTLAIESVQVYALDLAELNARAQSEFVLPKSSQFRAGKHGQFKLEPFVSVTRSDALERSNLVADRYTTEISGDADTLTFCDVGEGALYGLKNLAALKAKEKDRTGKAASSNAYLRGLT
jgi:hypothetical protein